MNSSNDKIAIIGMACRFPGANNLSEYWNNLIEGKDTIKHFTDEDLSKFEINYNDLKKNPAFVKARGILANIDKFDAEFFGMTPKEAAGTDPQHRLWLENAWEAFENAGCDPINYPGAIGVFAGGYLSTYLLNNILRDPVKLENYIRLRSTESYQIMMGNDVAFIPTKTAYKFNLKGPAINVQTACSTSLVAISQACQSLFSFESDLCLAGGVCVVVPQESGYIYQEGSIPSPDGMCRPFDSKGEGTVFSNGVGAVILKRFEDAVRDRDTIYALIRGWAINNDGSNKVSYMAPSIDGQAEAITMAQSFAEVNPEDISYIEAHGTATQLGDPIEIAALKKAFSQKTKKKQFCGIGSVKSNIGHTDAAAGVASFIKTCLAAYYRIIPPTLHFSEANKHIDFENSPFYVQKELRKWTEDRPLIMGVSSFGIGGTNAHVIVEEHAPKKQIDIQKSEWPELIVLSARSVDSLNQRKKDLIDFVNAKPDINIHDVANTLGTGRNHMLQRSFLVASDIEEIVSANKTFTDGLSSEINSKIAFMFPGQGAQYISMGKDLYNSNLLFRQILDECFDIVKSEIGEDIKTLLFTSTNNEEDEKRLAKTNITQPALFIIEYALTKLLDHFNIKPQYLVGHSIGEYTAACIAGVFDMQTALKIVIKRGQLMQSMPAGNMMAVRTSIDILKSLNTSYFEIAADNSRALCSISFKTDDIDRVKELLEENKIPYNLLNTSHGFHSAAFDPILLEFSKYVDQFELNTPKIPFISCLTGKFITPEQATSGSYWSQQLRNTVLFRLGVSLIAQDEGVVFLEVGPNTHLSSLVRQNKDVINKKTVIATLDKPGEVDEKYKIIGALGNMFNIGININFTVLHGGINTEKISLPTYPFEKKHHWIDFELSKIIEDQFNTYTKVNENDISGRKKIAANLAESGIGHIENNTGTILNIWKSLTGIDDIGLDEDFFELGGQSLLALQIITRIKEELNFNISLKTFYDNPTITKLNSIIVGENVSQKPGNEFIRTTNLTNLPLSTNQKGIWISTKVNNLNPAYNIPFTYHLRGNVNIDIFQKGINILFNRHPVIFSVFGTKDGIPYFDIVPKPVSVDLVDFSNETPETAVEKIHSFAGDDNRKVFNIESGPLYRLYLLKQDDSNFYFHATIHHLVFDGWSWNIFVKEFAKIYESLIFNRDLDLEEIKFQYYDYAKWEENYNNNLNEEISFKFWVDNLKGSNPKLNFPYDYPRIDITTGFGGKEYIRISNELTSMLKELSKKENTTLFPTVLSAIGILFQRYSGENDICIGTALSNRPQTKLEKIFGMFVNTTVIRLKIEENNNFSWLVRNTSNSVLEAIAHNDLTFERIVDAVRGERISNMNPLFQVALVWLGNAAVPMDFEGIKGEHVTVSKGVSPFDITFYLWENGDFIEGEIEYNIDILKRNTIIRLIDNLIHLVQSVVENPDQIISEYSLISENDKIRLAEFNNTEAPLADCLVQHFFENKSLIQPSKIAVTSGNFSLTYKELDDQANQLARHLVSLGVNGGDIVGICLERSAEMVVSVLGVLKAGCCYLPLDPSFPQERLKYMLEDSEAKFLISQSSQTEIIQNFGISSLVLVDNHKIKIRSYPVERPEINIDNSYPAYIIYTSGSTGRPKGVPVRHQAVVNLIESMSVTPGICDKDRLLAVVTLSFDMSIYELFLTLSNGATLVMASSQDVINGFTLIDLINKHNITLIQATPSFWHILLSSGWKGKKDLKALCGGEALSPGLVRQILPRVGEFWNCYGPTEITVYATCTRVLNPEDRIHIGKPINNTKTYLLDKKNMLLPLGVIGELAIGGIGVSKGYRNMPELTAEKFIKYEDGEIIYKTGDLGRYLEDGNIELFGRADNQIKLRGFRIEPGEIENQLAALPGVKEAVVKVHKFDEDDKRLVAFLNTDDSFFMTHEQIKEALAKIIPPYMIPSYYQISNGFQRLPNGKIDRMALPMPDFSDVNVSQYIPPSTAIERTLVKIWSGVLRISEEKISVKADFFDMGGDSIKSIQIVSRMHSAGYELKISEVMSHSILEAMASKVKELSRIIDQEVVSGKVLLNPIQLAFFKNDFAVGEPKEKNHFNQSFLLHFKEGISKEEVEAIFRKIVEQHDALRIVYTNDEGIWKQDIQGLHVSPFELQKFDLRQVKEAYKQLEDLSYSLKLSIDIEQGPLMKLGLFQMDDGDRLLITIHHLVIDLVSWRILFDDISTLLQQYKMGKKLSLPAKSDSFQYWMQKNAVYVEGYALKRELGYWQSQERKKTDIISVKHKEGSNLYLDVASSGFILTQKETAFVQACLNGKNKVEINTILLAALGQSLQKVFGINTIKINLEGHGREEFVDDVDISRTVGWFTCMYPVILELPATCIVDPSGLLTLDEGLKAVPNKGVGYGLIKYLSKHKLEYSQIPAQIIFNYLGGFDRIHGSDDSFIYALSDLSHGSNVALSLKRDAELEVTGQTIDGQLSMSIQYSIQRFDKETLNALTDLYKKELLSLAGLLSTNKARITVPSDFTYKGLSIGQIKALEQEYGRIENVYGPSPMQEGLYFIALTNPQTSAYFVQLGYRVEGRLDAIKMQQSYKELINRHSVLRTVFRNDINADLLQIVRTQTEPDFRFLDISAKSKEEQVAYIKEYKLKDRAEGFDLKKGQLIRLTILRLSEEEHEEVWSNHHLILDGWSMSTMRAEFNRLYENNFKESEFKLPALRPYSDYIEWLAKFDKESCKLYWREYLRGYDSLSSLPSDKMKKNKDKFSVINHEFKLSGQLTKQLQHTAVKYKCTLNTVMQCVWGILLSRYNNTNDVVFGSVVSGRPSRLKGVQEMVGLFINTVPQRIKYQPETRFSDLIRSVQQSFILGEPYHHMNLAEIQSLSQIGSGLLDHLMVFENYPISGNTSDTKENTEGLLKVKAGSVEVFEQLHYDFSLMIMPDKELFLNFKYNGESYTEEFIERLETQFKMIINNLVENPDTALKSLSMISDDEKKIIDSFSNTRTNYPGDKTIVQLFEEQVLLYGDKTAIVFKGESLTYNQLNERTNQLARTLRKSGVRDNTPVGILAEKSMDIILGILGILKSGGGYVPIDPEYPEQRINFIIRDSGCKVLVTQEKYMKITTEGVSKINLNSPSSYDKDKSNVKGINGPLDLAYIMYTSGTTGIPKGSMIAQKGVVRLVRNTNYIVLTPEDRILLTGAIVFDATTFEIWGAMLNGGTLYIVEKETILNPKALGEELANNDITILWLTSALLTQIAESSTYIFGKLKYLFSGGDVLSAPHINKVRKANPNLKVINCYGPTENTTFSTTYLIDKDFDSNIPIGKPINNSTTYIFDKRMNYQPIGVIGELYVGGDGVSIGYKNRDDLNMKSFVNHPHLPDERLYRTGDYARWLPDGNIEFHGRIDNQLKIRGFRVELGEIESAVSEIEGIVESVIKPIKIREGDTRLVAFLNVSKTFSMDTKEINRQLRQKLPPYMIPSAFKLLNGFPKTINGKTDKDALTVDLNDVLSRGEDQDLKNFTPNELIIYEIWCDALKTKDIYPTDNFFDIGGNSLLAISVFSKIESAFNVDLGLRIFFDAPRIKDLAEAIDLSLLKEVKQKSLKKSNEKDARIINGEI